MKTFGKLFAAAIVGLVLGSAALAGASPAEAFPRTGKPLSGTDLGSGR
ncbi:MAG: hypothetical protein JNM29_05415 [Candidatus Odyssella sp.]|nr:hypothetical protein [Candidatus Odyssella sp.]